MQTNSAFLFIKPEVAHNDKVRQFIAQELLNHGITIESEGEILSQEINSKMLIDNHYYAIARYAVLFKLQNIPVPAAIFEEKYGISWKSVLESGLSFNAQDAAKKLGLTPKELERKWRGGNVVKFGGGFYCSEMDGLYVFNGFFLSMREKYVAPGQMIHYMNVQWNSDTLSWKDFRLKVLGATDPSKAVERSIRGLLRSNWKSLGMTIEPSVGANGLHGSASPFEALIERLNWCKDDLSNIPFGKQLLDAGIAEELIQEWAKDPQVMVSTKDTLKSLFDVLEDMDAECCIETAVRLQSFNNVHKFDTTK